MSNENIIEIFNKIFAAYAFILLVFGTILNSLIVFICSKSKLLRSNSTFKLVALIAISDLMSLFEWNCENFTITFFNFAAYTQSLFYCRFFSVFLQFCTLEFSSLMWLSISINRYLSIQVKHWNRTHFHGFRPFVYAFLIALIIFAVNSVELFKTGYSYQENGTEIIVCYATSQDDYYWFDTMTNVNS